MERCLNCPNPKLQCQSITMSKYQISKEELYKQICEALQQLYSENSYLIEHKVNEVCLSSHFWFYFKMKFSDIYNEYNIDPEYNKNGENPKYYYDATGCEIHIAKPDMVIHKRGCNKNNFAYFEFKTSWSTDKSGNHKDIKKLKAFTSTNEVFRYIGKLYSYNYLYGIHIRLCRDKAEIFWYSNGEYESENEWKYIVEK